MVVKDTVITSAETIGESRTLRRLDVGEVVEILEGPVKDEVVEVDRIKARVMKDDIKGWITMTSNTGAAFLADGGNLFKVVKETIMTSSFELEAEAGSKKPEKLKDTTRKLKEGELVLVREWPRKEEKSGLMRMKCKAKLDGALGWVTTIGNQGNVYLEVL